MKNVLVAALLALPLVAGATGGSVPGTEGSLRTHRPGPDIPPILINLPQGGDGGQGGVGGNGGQGGAGGSGGNANATAGSTATTGPITMGSQLAIEWRTAQAPDVISYPTAPCRISIGASGGWFGGAIGFSGSSLDEACSRIETSRHLHNLGAREAAVQIMCLSPEAKQALEATGLKCLIKAEAQTEQVKP